MQTIAASDHGYDWPGEEKEERSTLMRRGKRERARNFESPRLPHLNDATPEKDFTLTLKRAASTAKAARATVARVMKRFFDRCSSIRSRSRSKKGRIKMPSSCERPAQTAAKKHDSLQVHPPWRILLSAQRRQTSTKKVHRAYDRPLIHATTSVLVGSESHSRHTAAAGRGGALSLLRSAKARLLFARWRAMLV